MSPRWLALIGLGSLLCASAQAGTLTSCTATYYGIGGTTRVTISAGRCTMSTSYGIHGDIFPGTGTDAQNAASLFCGSADATVIAANVVGFQVLAAYDSDFSTLRIVRPTHVGASL